MKKKIAVLLGGISAEKNVSLKTGKYVSKSLKQQGYKVKEIKVTKNERDLIKGEFKNVALEFKFINSGLFIIATCPDHPDILTAKTFLSHPKLIELITFNIFQRSKKNGVRRFARGVNNYSIDCLQRGSFTGPISLIPLLNIGQNGGICTLPTVFLQLFITSPRSNI